MDVTAGSVASTMRLGLQVLSSHREPYLEIYVQLRHTKGPAEEIPLGSFGAGRGPTRIYRPQEVAFEFTIVNLGGERAERIRFTLIGDFEYHQGSAKLSGIPLLSGQLHIPQLAPAQVLHLFRFDDSDLLHYGVDGKPQRMKDRGFSIRLDYDGPALGFNRLKRGLTRIRRNRQFRRVFTFDPRIYELLDLPLPEMLV